MGGASPRRSSPRRRPGARRRWLRRRLARAWRRVKTVLWDVFMVYLAILNVGLIVFDITYLWLRPTYFRVAPPVVRVYDGWVKGIEPHPPTERLLAATEALAATLASPGASRVEVAARLAEVRRCTAELFATNPFDRSGQSANLARLEARVRRFLRAGLGREAPPTATAGELLAALWPAAGSSSVAALAPRVAFFEAELRPLLAVNYHREYDLDGAFVDRFWLLDLPFLLIFATEFLVRWLLAVRRGLYPKWFLFPLFNWYDVLGLVPVKELRFFRLFRIASIYVRLYRSEHTGVGRDVVSRTVRYFANVISEEVSDMVSLRILNETQEELRSGTHRRIVQAVAPPRREALAREIVARTHAVLASAGAQERLRSYLEANLARSVARGGVFDRVPLPRAVVRPLVEAIGQLVFDALVETLTSTLETERGRAALEELVQASIDGLVEDLTSGETEKLVREISIEAIEHVKSAVRVRKWVEAEKPAPGGG